MCHEKKPLDFGGNPDHVTLGFGLGGYCYCYADDSRYSATLCVVAVGQVISLAMFYRASV